VRSSAILLKPGVGYFVFLKQTDEIVEHRTVTFTVHCFFKEYRDNNVPSRYRNPHSKFLVMQRFFMHSMRILRRTQSCVLCVNRTREVEPGLISKEVTSRISTVFI
jgi:hypothetical protein